MKASDKPQDSPEIKDNPPMEDVTSTASSPSEPSTYGPIRRRAGGKSGPAVIFRPPAMLQDDVVELLKRSWNCLREVGPRMVGASIEGDQAEAGQKRRHEEVVPAGENAEEPPTVRPRTDALSAQVDSAVEVLSVQEVSDLMPQWQEDPTCEALVANYLQKKTSKQSPPSNNDPALQHLVDESKTSEWQALIEKGAIKVHYAKRAEAIKRD